MKLAVLGDPVAHSLSPALHQAALDATGIPGEYRALRVDADGMVDAVDAIRRGELDGANVTMPHKARALELVDDAVEAARRAGAVNTLVRVAGRVIGHNTDIGGVQTAWQWGGLPDGGSVIVLGAGGAAAAAVLALEGRDLTIAARRPATAEDLLVRLGVAGRVTDLTSPVPGGVLVNATPIGMRGEHLPDVMLREASGLFDMAYGPAPTPAVRWARREGLPVVAGPDMLLAQAMASFRLWTGRPAPETAMRRALERAQGAPSGTA
ncbi:MAG: shikimate dehydrogenase [Acidimicrobiia bacterium]